MDAAELETEADWVRRSQRGERNAFGLLVTKYMKQAYYVALSYLGSHEEALDASQDAFVKAYRAIAGFDTRRRFFTWYFQILKNHCLNLLRNRRNDTAPLSMYEEVLDKASDEPGADELLEQAERRTAVWAALWELKPEDRQIIVARDMLDTPYAMLAELMECPEGTVMSRLFHARRRLRTILDGRI